MRLTSSVAGFGRRVVAVALVGAMVAPSAAFAGSRPRKVGKGPDAAATLAQWSRVQQMPHEDIDVVTDGRSGRFMLLAADEDAITVLVTDTKVLPRGVVRGLRAIARENPTLLTQRIATAIVKRGDLEIGPLGLFVKGERLADTSAVVLQVPREQVRAIRGKVMASGNATLAVLGGLAGGFVGFLVAFPIADSADGSAGQFYGTWLGITAGSAALLGSAGTHQADGVVYQRLDTPPPAVR